MIKNIPVKKLVEFRRLSERSKSTFANNLKLPKKPKGEDSGGGNYWIRSISGISNSFKANDNTIIQEKIDSVSSAYEATKIESTLTMYKRNLEILHNYIDFDFSVWYPSAEVKFLANPQIILTIKGIPVQIAPNHVFIYEDDGEEYIGAIWFVCWLDGFSLGDLGVFSETLFMYLSFLYSKKYKIKPENCLTVDIVALEALGYDKVIKGDVPSLLNSTIDTLNKYL